jgi:RNA polymerase sigma factor (TIGR02999 family)
MATNDPSITVLLQQARDGNTEAWNQAFALIYDELKKTARRVIGAHGVATLNPTGLVHECYLRLVDLAGDGISNRAHFQALAARAMRFVLINRARDRCTQKRGLGQATVSLNEQLGFENSDDAHEVREAMEFIALDQALVKLEKENPLHVRLLECRVFAGLSEVESAEAVQLPLREMQRQFAAAKARITEILAD